MDFVDNCIETLVPKQLINFVVNLLLLDINLGKTTRKIDELGFTDIDPFVLLKHEV